MDIKQPINNDSKWQTAKKVIRIVFNPVTNIVIGAVILFLVFNVVIKVYHYYNDNPYLLELQQIISEQYGTDFSVVVNCKKNEKISMVVIESTDEIYLSKDIFFKVNNLQKTVYRFVMCNQESFCDIDWVIPKPNEQVTKKEGLKLLLSNSDYSDSSGLSNVFRFYNRLEYKNENTDGFNSLLVNTHSDQPDSHYSNIKVSDLVEFSDINFIQCLNINIDDASSLKRMKNLKEISVGEYAEEIKKVAKEMGIKCY